MRLFLKTHPCFCDFDHNGKVFIIGNDDWPVEYIKGRPVINFIRRILHGHHKENIWCYESRTGRRVSGAEPTEIAYSQFPRKRRGEKEKWEKEKCARCNDNGCPACDGTKGSPYNPEPF